MVPIMAGGDTASAKLFETLERLRRTWLKGGWSWDTRFNCVASSFPVELTNDAAGVVLSALPHEYNYRTIQSAPKVVQDVAENTGGVRADQRLFCSTPGGRIVAFGLWWPWGDDVTISMRVGLGGYYTDGDLMRFREVFGALD